VAKQRVMLRLLLPVLTAIGIAGMHTLGHPGREGTGVYGHQAAMQVHQAPMAEAAGAAMTVVGDSHGAGMGMDPLSVCVAILVGGLLVLLVAVMVRDSRRWMPGPHAETAVVATVRGPPKPSRLGLRLAHLSVQRI
jgi:hypothetical protein